MQMPNSLSKQNFLQMSYSSWRGKSCMKATGKKSTWQAYPPAPPLGGLIIDRHTQDYNVVFVFSGMERALCTRIIDKGFVPAAAAD